MIRPATLDDLPALLVLGEAMHAESPRFSRMQFDVDRLERTLQMVLSSDLGFARVVELRDGTIAGGLVALITPHWFSPDLTACDLALFMAPDQRGSIAPARLLAAYVLWAKEHGSKQTQLGIMTGVHVDETVALCERLGWRRAGVVMEI